MLQIAILLLQNNAVAFDKEEFSFQIQSHPSYPSLHSITGVFDHFNIENVAAKVPVNKETLAQLPLSFIAQIGGRKGLQLVLAKKSKKNYDIYDANKKRKILSEDDFLKTFTGIILAVDKGENEAIKVADSNFVRKASF